jgi:hypothetical protein
VANSRTTILQQHNGAHTIGRQAPERAPAKAIHVPSNKDLPQYTHLAPPLAATQIKPANPTWEAFNRADADEEHLHDPKKSATDAEKDLKEFFQQAFDGREDGEEEEPIDMADAIVDGFQDDVTLLPHQIVGRKWMAEREAGKKRGGILADDMGLGKTIQTLTRIVEGRPKKTDRQDGWAASTL